MHKLRSMLIVFIVLFVSCKQRSDSSHVVALTMESKISAETPSARLTFLLSANLDPVELEYVLGIAKLNEKNSYFVFKLSDDLTRNGQTSTIDKLSRATTSANVSSTLVTAYLNGHRPSTQHMEQLTKLSTSHASMLPGKDIGELQNILIKYLPMEETARRQLLQKFGWTNSVELDLPQRYFVFELLEFLERNGVVSKVKDLAMALPSPSL